MWYRIDFTKLVMQLVPPILRSEVLLALLGVLTVPLRYVYDRFCALKGTVDDRLNITGNVQYLEKALNDTFFLKDCQIYIETPEGEKTPSFYFSKENQRANVFRRTTEGTGFVLRQAGESGIKVNFKVMVPTFLCTSLESKGDDRYGWQYLTTIKNIIKIYKPAGRTFSIELYDYE